MARWARCYPACVLHDRAISVGWLHCPSGRDVLVAVNEEQRSAVASGAMACPGCSETCGAEFELAEVNADVQVTAWRNDRWERGFALHLAP